MAPADDLVVGEHDVGRDVVPDAGTDELLAGLDLRLAHRGADDLSGLGGVGRLAGLDRGGDLLHAAGLARLHVDHDNVLHGRLVAPGRLAGLGRGLHRLGAGVGLHQRRQSGVDALEHLEG